MIASYIVMSHSWGRHHRKRHSGLWSGDRYFARIAEERMGPEDQVILVTHQPRWLMDWFWEEAATHNLRQLVRGHLRGRARVHLAGKVPLNVQREVLVEI